MRYTLTVSAVAISTFLGLVLFDAGRAPASAAALAAEKGAGLEDFMLVVHGPKGLLKQLQEVFGGAGPADGKAWKAVKAEASIISFLTDSILEKSSPSKGDKASWKAKVGEYSKMAKALSKAAGDKDANAMKAELGKLAKSCEGCHKAHR